MKNKRDTIIRALETHLDTRDKRFMFLKINFRRLVARIQLEGSAQDTAWNIYEEMEKQQELDLLVNILNNCFDTKILLNGE